MIIKIAALGIIVAILCQVLKQSGREEYSYFVGLAALIVILGWLLPYVYD
ncbi:MAG: stage III sporulation AC/AD family protein, partial [Spirochaetales bacterium]|nr:stage III sporulation AC/AD family protein [Spirochaetales bacterium]